jgi:hypothetical protein
MPEKKESADKMKVQRPLAPGKEISKVEEL